MLEWFRKRAARFRRTRTMLESVAMSEVQDLLDERGANNPEPGDYWDEMFVPVCLVLAVSDTHVRFLDKTLVVNYGKWSWDVDSSKVVTRHEFANLHKYKSIPGYSCNVSRGCGSTMEWIKENRPELLIPPTWATVEASA